MFNSRKVLESISYLLKLNLGKMNLLKLMKELYIADRKSIEDSLVSISGDNWSSMKHGPVLGNTCNLLYSLNDNEWGEYLETKKVDKYYPQIVLKKECKLNALSDYEIDILKKTYNEFREMDEWEIEEYTHNFPEWKKTESSIPIQYEDIARAVGYNDSDIEYAKAELGA